MNILGYKLFEEQSRADLYHAIKPEYAINSLNTNKLDCYSIQRTWPNGIRLKDDHPEYENSDYLRGLSLTRDIDYAKNWQSIVFVFDQEKLKTKWKLLPYNWGYSIGGDYKQGIRAKREKEEFLITGFSKGPLKREKFLKEIQTPQGEIAPLDKYLKGFLINPEYMKDENYEFFTNHKLFGGFFERESNKFKLGKKK
jgi:hypothetical protein